ncbi:amino acid ABC transporter permease [Nesterenkonia lutea]|uniref:His/Glu/Gln/Arg/opine family amino acid ABC transporter permease subunit n=1 Tax=Nesterenkonia lutea TaxID=272919 RepID=A0ABR9JJ27_9MICC|nr:amino acid ABC transporter permease [Nesterenkonia lutea]MBE1525537.1 His/Glu/Gln/Arg/opine family amino acid ABC transporter permease subunit [Nesterenkonia lutea]
MYEFDWSVVQEYAPYVASGVPLTLFIALSAIAGGIVLGMPLGVLLVRSWRPLQWLIRVYVEVFRNIPVLVQVVWLYYALPIVSGQTIDGVTAGIVAIGLNASAYLADITRGGIIGMASGQSEAARSLGMSARQTMTKVILPQAWRRLIAPFAGMFVVIVKNTALVSYIGVLDILHRGNVVQTHTFRPLEAYTLVAIFYFLVVSAVVFAMRGVERRWSPAIE